MHKKGFIGVRSVVLSAMATCLLSLVMACGGGGDGGSGPGQSATSTLTASPESIPADAKSATILTATLVDSAGNPVNHYTQVTFSTTLGHFRNGGKTYSVETQPPLDEKGWPDPSQDPTGIAQVSLTAGYVPGTTYVKAVSNNVSQAVAIVFTKTAPVRSEITVEASPERFPADGRTQSVITATVLKKPGFQAKQAGASATPLGGVPVTFYKITSNVEPQPLPEANTYKGTGTSIAGPFYSSGGNTTFHMTADPVSTINEYFTVWLFNPLSGSRELLINRANWGYTDVLSEQKAVSLLPGNYQLEIQTNCYYEIKVVGNIGPAQTGKTVLGFASTDGYGKAVYTYTADWLQGSFEIMAETGELSNSENALSEAVTLTQTGSGSSLIGINAATDRIYANGEESTTVTAQVWTEAGNKAPDGTMVYFSTTSGTIDATGVTVDGLASAQLTSVASESSINATVTARSGPHAASTNVTFVGVALTDMLASPAIVFANGTNTSEVSVRLRDADGRAVAGKSITFTTTAGSIQSSTTPVTDNNGVARVTIIAPTSACTATVTARYGLTQATTVITYTDQPVGGNIVLTAEPETIPADGTSSSVITATVTDGTGNPVPRGTEVTFTTTLGTFSNGSTTYTVSTSDDLGVVSVALVAGTTTGSARVTATSQGISQSIYVGIGGLPLSIALSADPTTIVADGSSSSTITAVLKDGSGQPVTPGTSVTFTTDLGTFSNDSTTYTVETADASGSVSVALIAGTTAGTATVTASAEGVQQSVQVTFTHGGNQGLPASEEFSLSAWYRNVSGLWISSLEDLITASVGDVYGNAVKDNTVISFKTYNTGGFFSQDHAPTVGGFASSTLYTTGGPAPLQGFAFLTGETTGGPTTRVSAISVTPYPDQHILYAGTNGGGVYKSTNAGVTWETVSRSTQNFKQGQNVIDPYIKNHSAICVDPDDPNTVYVGTGYLGRGNVFRSLDGGLNWNSNNVEEFNGLFENNAAVLTVLCDGDSDTTTNYPYVWIGTEGRGPLFATDGKTFQPSNGVATPPAFSGTGNGTMTHPVLWYSSKTETWTAVCVVENGTASTPVFTGTGDGNMTPIQTSATTKTENWTVTYGATAGAVTATPKANDGGVAEINVKQVHTATETWTLTCINAGSKLFSVRSEDANGITYAYPNATADTPYSSDAIDFTIVSGSDPFSDGSDSSPTSSFTFTTTASWRVVGTVSGVQTPAFTGVPYTSDGGEVGFTITEGFIPFAAGDQFTFSTVEGITYWNVSGTVSGLQSKRAFNDRYYISDNREVRFTIYEGSVPFADGDMFQFAVTASNVGHGWNVWDMVRVPGTHGGTAVLYLATSVGVYKSLNGAQTWNSLGTFTGDFVTALALYPTARGGGGDILYAGTQNGGVWVSTNSGASWTQYAGGISGGASATVKDILVDGINNKLYALVYSGSPEAATGKVYVHDLTGGGGMAGGNWREAGAGLPGTALHAMALDRPQAPASLFAGGEGINLFKASSGLDTGALEWNESKSGVSNLIMSRMPVLFSGQCTMTVYPVFLGDSRFYFEVYIEDVNGNPPLEGSAFMADLYDAGGNVILPSPWFSKTYGDSITNQGTYRDPSDPTTNNPIVTPVVDFAGTVAKVTFTFTPTCCPDPDDPTCLRDNVTVPEPGCSGAAQTYSFGY